MTLQQYVDSIKDKRIAVIGIGVSNTPLIELLCANGCDVTACDRRSLEQMEGEGERLASLGAKLKLGEGYLDGLDQDLIFRTPGLMPFDPKLEAAKARGSVITSEMEVFFSLCPCRIFSVTGSDGKTTTTTIISELLKAAGYTVHLGGNIGHPLLCEIPSFRETDLVVLELSSFQLHSMSCKPDVAVITNISPNHLDKHKDYQDYIDAKRFIYATQTSEDKLVLNYDDEQTPYYLSTAESHVAYFSDTASVKHGTVVSEGMVFWVDGEEREAILRTDEIRLPGRHNLLNYLAAFEAVRGYVSAEICREVAMNFGGVAHRLEHVRELHGVTYINDSIGTSPTRTIAGLHALKKKLIVIVGGYDKHIPFDSLGDELCKYAKRVILTGDTAEKIRDSIVSSAYFDAKALPLTEVREFEDAVKTASAFAESGDIVLLSPACASFDRFKNFEDRGNLFKKLVMELQ